jgi:phosphomevalonate kinase
MLRTTVISAPGKVLIAGGYLVLDPAYSGVVVSTSSRFYTALRDEPSLKPNTIRVRSPQFIDATWQYSAVLEPSVLIEPFGEKCVVQYRIILDRIFSHPLISSSKNKFVHLALQHTLSLAVEIKGVEAIREALSRALDITIVGDNDFYSQRARVKHSDFLIYLPNLMVMCSSKL